jgi:hypothetical protein
LAAAISGSVLYVSSELAPIHLVEPNVEKSWTPEGGEAVIGRLGEMPRPPAWLKPTKQYAAKELSHV